MGGPAVRGSAPLPNGATGPLPASVDTWAKLITQVGLPTLFSIVLLYVVINDVRGTMKVIEANEEARTKLLQDTQSAFIEAIEKSADRFERAIDKNIQVNREIAERYHGRNAPPN